MDIYDKAKIITESWQEEQFNDLNLPYMRVPTQGSLVEKIRGEIMTQLNIDKYIMAVLNEKKINIKLDGKEIFNRVKQGYTDKI